jgi:hypothetical protein
MKRSSMELLIEMFIKQMLLSEWLFNQKLLSEMFINQKLLRETFINEINKNYPSQVQFYEVGSNPEGIKINLN